MALVNHMAHGDVPIDADHGLPTWACTGCGRCAQRCDHAIPVGVVMRSARAELVKNGVRPPSLERIRDKVSESDAAMRRGADELAGEPGFDAASDHALLIGCAYHRGAREEARLALRVAHALTGERYRVVSSCCGAPFADAGLPDSGRARAVAIASEHAGLASMVVVDAGCASYLTSERTPGLPAPVTLVELAAQHLERFEVAPGLGEDPVRWHDPCRLGRGLGVYEAPRQVLARIFGRSPDEFAERREQSACSGAGGLVPLTYPEAASGAARRRVAEHEELGGGRMVTACASSLQSFRKAGAEADDIVRWMARSLGVERG
jgi:Fe-S oxidoreductase